MHVERSWWSQAAFTATLTMTMGIGPFALAAVSALSPSIVVDLALTRTQLGSLATVAFGVAAATSVLGGRQVGVLSGRTVLAWIFLSGGAGAAVMANVRSLQGLWLGAVFCGASLAMANPVTNHLIASYTPVGRQGLQTGLKQSGVPMTQAVVGFVLPPLALLLGWRSSILMGVFFALFGFIVAWRAVPRPSAAVIGGPTTSGLEASAFVKWLTAYTFAVAMITATVMVYAPLYAFEQLSLTATTAGMATGVTGAAGMAARILWSWLAEFREASGQALTAIAGTAFVSVLLVLASQFVGPWLLWIGLLSFGSSAVAANAVVMLAVIRGVAIERTARATGFVGLGLFLGFMTGPVTFGVIVDRTSSYTAGWLFVAGICIAAVAIIRAWRRDTTLSSH